MKVTADLLRGFGALGLTVEQVAGVVGLLEADDAERRTKERDKKRRGRGLRPVEREWIALRRFVFKRDGMVCKYCGTTSGPFHCDHVVAVSKGGPNHPDNLVVACRRCNSSKRDRSLAEWSR